MLLRIWKSTAQSDYDLDGGIGTRMIDENVVLHCERGRNNG